MIERNGRRLSEILVKNNPWSSEPCTRQNCPVCQQEVRPKVPGCHRRNITYVNVCLTCEEEGIKTQYVGESSRSLAERYQEHLDDAKGKNKEESHMWTHSGDQHQGIMRYKVSQKKGHKSAMMRQISESIEIKIRSAEGIQLLNNKAEYNRCLLPELVVQLGKNKVSEVSESDESREKYFKQGRKRDESKQEEKEERKNKIGDQPDNKRRKRM